MCIIWNLSINNIIVLTGILENYVERRTSARNGAQVCSVRDAEEKQRITIIILLSHRTAKTKNQCYYYIV